MATYIERTIETIWRMEVLTAALYAQPCEIDEVNERGNDWPQWFVRVVEDPYVNDAPDRQFRVAAGVRF